MGGGYDMNVGDDTDVTDTTASTDTGDLFEAGAEVRAIIEPERMEVENHGKIGAVEPLGATEEASLGVLRFEKRN